MILTVDQEYLCHDCYEKRECCSPDDKRIRDIIECNEDEADFECEDCGETYSQDEHCMDSDIVDYIN